MMHFASLFEPEELVGSYWHRLVANTGNEARFPEAAVALPAMRHRLEVFFRGLGGKAGVEIKPIAPMPANYRKRLLAKIGHTPGLVTRARFDGDHLFLPETVELLPDPHDNEKIYKWLVAWAAAAGNECPRSDTDPLRNDLFALRFFHATSEQVFERFPGMKIIYDQILPQLLHNRIERKLPKQEAAVESCIHIILAGHQKLEPAEELAGDFACAVFNSEVNLNNITAASGYRPFLPFPLWGEIVPPDIGLAGQRKDPEEQTESTSNDGDERSRKARRQASDQIERNDPLVINRFEAILSWAEMMNIPRAVDDEEEDAARKAADDSEELGLANLSRKAATRLKFDLDLAPEDVVHERLAAKYVYPEWDYRKCVYHADHCRVLAASAPLMQEGQNWQPDRQARKRIRSVKRQFEALRPKRQRFHRQVDGDEIDIDAVIRSKCDLAASGEGSSRLFTATRASARDLSVAVLIDTSRSSESWIEGRQIIEISKEALLALSLGLAACGDDNAIYSFSSLRRDRVFVSTIKDFRQPLGTDVFSRIGALRPGFYTRLGAATRHVTKELLQTNGSRRLLLILTDGKPNDLDHYEGRYGIEDSAKAIREARHLGVSVFGLTIDKQAQSYFPYIFGRNAYSITPHANHLTRALPLMYRHLVT